MVSPSQYDEAKYRAADGSSPPVFGAWQIVAVVHRSSGGGGGPAGMRMLQMRGADGRSTPKYPVA